MNLSPKTARLRSAAAFAAAAYAAWQTQTKSASAELGICLVANVSSNRRAPGEPCKPCKPRRSCARPR